MSNLQVPNLGLTWSQPHLIMSAPSSSEPDLIDLARRIAHAHCNTPSVSCHLHDEQDYFSKTYIVKLEDQSNIIVRFRDTPLDLSFYEVARGTLFFARIYTPPLSFCREIGSSRSNYREEERRYRCFQACLHHELHRWNSALGAWPGAWDDDAAIAGQLGDALSRCIVGPNSSEVVQSYIIPRLKTVLLENIPSDRLELRRSVEELISIAPNLRKLPLSLSHLDLNTTNVRKPS